MAYYKDLSFFSQTDDAIFDLFQEPGSPAPYSGIYRCAECAHETTFSKGQLLPPENHHHHQSGCVVRWQLIAAAMHVG
jgi:hypothetical protein